MGKGLQVRFQDVLYECLVSLSTALRMQKGELYSDDMHVIAKDWADDLKKYDEGVLRRVTAELRTTEETFPTLAKMIRLCEEACRSQNKSAILVGKHGGHYTMCSFLGCSNAGTMSFGTFSEKWYCNRHWKMIQRGHTH